MRADQLAAVESSEAYFDAYRSRAQAVRVAEAEVIAAARWWARDRSAVSGSVLTAAVGKLDAAEGVG